MFKFLKIPTSGLNFGSNFRGKRERDRGLPSDTREKEVEREYKNKQGCACPGDCLGLLLLLSKIMDSPLYVLAMSAESELHSIKAQQKSKTGNDNGDDSSLSPRATTIALANDTSLEEKQNPTKNEFEGYLKSLMSPPEADGKTLRIVTATSNAAGNRLDPFAVVLIETVLSKGTSILSRPVFPYTFESEPLYCMEIRTHLLRRYAALPRDADRPTLVAATETLLRLWGYKLVYSYSGRAVTSPPSPPPPLSPMAREKTLTSVTTMPRPDRMLRLVSPLKRPSRSNKAPVTITKDSESDSADGLSPLIVKNDPETNASILGSQGKKVPRDDFAFYDGPVKQETPVDYQVDVSIKKALVAGKENVPKKRGKNLLAVKHKKRAPKLKGLLRRWTQHERDLYLHGMEVHGVGATDEFYRMLPGK